ncbi:hypothetical protein O181_078168 [Austropuccinia psidii MF-1]|uniref:Uncharacterized protein n=1 Tax=Austropuccinia psidii MF-1 TaxID=1389203 RepID=A0A9Q3FIF4_9BASI|nr:hypothetical protein [Austropuccinia psidii MF-1]
MGSKAQMAILAPYSLYGPWSVEPLGPFWPKSHESKRGQGGNPPAPKARWVPPEPIFAPNLNNPKNGQKGTRKHILATSSGSERFPLNSGEDLSFTNVIHTKGSRRDAYMV